MKSNSILRVLVVLPDERGLNKGRRGAAPPQEEQHRGCSMTARLHFACSHRRAQDNLLGITIRRGA
jgi:hypothetical protein